jgi:predicted dienelactone hydrolase
LALALLAAPASAQADFANGPVPSWLPPSPVKDLAVTLPNGDEADVYAPVVMPRMRQRFEDAFPVVALLQGALVEKGQYRRFGRLLASQGFVVVVPDHLRIFPGIPVPVRFSEVGVVTAVYEGMLAADADRHSPLYGIVDTDTMGMVGHSLGGFVGLYAIAGECNWQICTEPGGTYEPPSALRAGAVYGANLVDFDGSLIDLDTSRASVALMQGSLDGIAAPEDAEDTYPILEPPRALMTLNGATCLSG